ncbi:MAG: electron transfer flavoprotein subunit alpha [Bacteroidetes bacterium CG02_land_8_20_14_3_00_31_25]|nr:electron transfer flavoprotein subunit alpha/FixB family protein [Bacteroidota bacterium]PIV58467.1 MAG: electron transfer flavoprotein subunit alpha [Bacteroidetes bacterium CG02_land_8_20_14_3_00_31_25]PIX36537.1 MAG: electron transfer flavoprotein subunit alpha [Bacteroidetes bacterium CG_4_8_14_3_um_filter_31_14]PIY07199.1 MAG: electron transfer flavoprotein subunit alpha [Bacteroidetes bacterium CG_4_10_14_3_um_filter_31_20]
MNNIFVFCEIEDNNIVADVSLELLTKGKTLANELNCKLEAFVLGNNLNGIEKQIFPYGVDVLHVADEPRLFPYLTLPFASIITSLFEQEKPQIVIFGASTIGRDLAPRIASYMRCGLTADCTSLVIGNHSENRTGKEYKNLLYQIRPAFGGNILATIINPETRPQIATVREGVMKKEIFALDYKGIIKNIDVTNYIKDEDFLVRIIERHIEPKKVNIKNANIIVSGGYGVGSKENFKLLYELAEILGAEVGGSRAAVDAGYIEHERQIGQTGVTVRPKLYIACGISGQIQHRAGMFESSLIISINSDKNAPINNIADYAIIGDINEVIPKMIKYYKQNSK